MQRTGRTHLATYRINAVEKRVKRDGKVLENLGWFEPANLDASKRLHLETDRIKHWLQHGAQPSDTVMDLLIANGLVDGTEWKQRQEARAKAAVVGAAKRAEIEAANAAAAKAKKDAKK
jgi:small subunit ribosomal protein S16